MIQAADNPDPAGDAERTDVGVPGMDGGSHTHAALPAEGIVAGALMPAPEPAQPDGGASIAAPLIAHEAMLSILDSMATTLKRLDERLGRLEAQPQLRGPARRLAGLSSAS